MALYELGNQAWIYTFFALAYLILLYLIRPKPRTIKIPSLMFLMRDKGKSRFTSFFQKLLRELLLLIQLLILFFLILSILQPSIFMDIDISSKNTIIVLDVSASMQALEGSKTRYEIALSMAKDFLGDKNTIVLAKNVPVVGLEEANRRDTLDYLKRVRTTETSSRIGAAMLTAGELMKEKDGRIIVISDFINTDGIQPKTAKLALESKGVTVDLINIYDGKEKSNVGIIDLNIDEDSSTVYVKNYNKQERTINLLIGSTQKTITIPGLSIEPYSFKTPEGVNDIEIIESDDFLLDNGIKINSPIKETITVLLITNNKSFYTETVLTSLPFVNLEISEPPIVSKDKYDVYITDQVDSKEVLPGTLEAILDYVGSGSNLIVHAQPMVGSLDFKNYLPVEFTGLGNSTYISIDQLTKLTRNIELGRVHKYFTTTPKEETITIASADGSPILSYISHGDGKIFYYGILEDASDFKLTPYYPIFWNNLLKFLVEKYNIRSLNLKTGDTIIRQEDIKVKTPYETLDTNSLLLDHAGIYTIDGVETAVNFLNEEESNINSNLESSKTPQKFSLIPVTENQRVNVEMILIIIASILLSFELIYVKLRGDL